MLIIGELINSTRKRVKKAIEEKDAAFIQDLALRQEKAGAGWIDVNAGAFAEEEVAKLTWMIGVIRAVTQAPLSIDSPRPAAVEAGLALAGSGAFLNSISAEGERYKSLLPFIKKHSCNVVALSLDDNGMSEEADTVYDVADGLIKRLEDDGVPPERIFCDPLLRPVSTNTEYVNMALSVVEKITAKHPLVHRICGLSNVSFGLPKRRLVNEVFAVLAIARGMDSAIADPLDERLMAGIAAAELLTGKDQFCMNYIGAERSGKLEGMG
jgi:cobalamin-dependent methionine synthase I